MPPMQVWAELYANGSLQLRHGCHSKAVTFQDSCNFIRNAGMYRQSRLLMHALSTDFREMHPNGNATYCCGNGGGQGLMPEYRQQKIAAMKAKAECIRRTEAEVVVVACHNCEDGIKDTCKHYEIDAEVILFSEYIAEAIS